MNLFDDEATLRMAYKKKHAMEKDVGKHEGNEEQMKRAKFVR